MDIRWPFGKKIPFDIDLCKTVNASLWLVTYDVCRNWHSKRVFLHENRCYLKVNYLTAIPLAKPILITCDLSRSLKTPLTKSSEKLCTFVPFFALSLNSILQARRSTLPTLLCHQNSIVFGPTATTLSLGVATMKKWENLWGESCWICRNA